MSARPVDVLAAVTRAGNVLVAHAPRSARDPVLVELNQIPAAVAALTAAAKAALAYDAAIKACADDPGRMSSYCTAQGDDLDTLYADWQEKSRAALARIGGAA